MHPRYNDREHDICLPYRQYFRKLYQTDDPAPPGSHRNVGKSAALYDMHTASEHCPEYHMLPERKYLQYGGHLLRMQPPEKYTPGVELLPAQQ